MTRTWSTTAVARLLGVAPGSVVNWIDQGDLPAGRTPGGHRRVTSEDLLEFLHKHKLPIPSELTATAPKVLVVDDEPGVVKWLTAEVRGAFPDCELHQAQDGYAAGQQVATLRPDVVILDLRMPGMDGFEVCRGLKADPQTRHATVIAITARPSPAVVARIRECGAVACLAKPLDITVLLELVGKALNKRK